MKLWFTACAMLLLAASPIRLTAAPPTSRVRSVHGVVTDKRGNILKGAAVQLENPATLSILSAITGENGQYSFHRLSTEIDYELTAKYKRWFSKTKVLSKFDSKEEAEINLEIPVE